MYFLEERGLMRDREMQRIPQEVDLPFMIGVDLVKRVEGLSLAEYGTELHQQILARMHRTPLVEEDLEPGPNYAQRLCDKYDRKREVRSYGK
jgi:hypothetical protein